MSKDMDIQNNIRKLMDNNIINMVKDKYNTVYCLINCKTDIVRVYLFYTKEFIMGFEKAYMKQFNKLLTTQEVQSAIEFIEVIGTDNLEEVEICKRIFNNGETYLYELSQDGKAVWIENSKATIETVTGLIFKHSASFSNQAEPNLKVKPENLLVYVKNYFNFSSEVEVKLFTLYLVTSFWGLNINHPILVLTGEKGSSKSTTMRKLDMLIDPKNSVGGGIPKGSDGLELRLSNSYFMVFDNLSSLSRKVSDTLATAVTGGSANKRVLYHDTAEIVTILDRNYGQYRGNADMGGYILFFENIQTYRNYFERVIDFYHLDKNMYEYSECVRNGQQSGTEWHEEMYLLSSDDALVFIYPCEIKSI